ncbi:MAG: Hut operon positive regulatory protein [Candidatus Midichloria mitochondrii]|uniref:Uncharacterized protein n=1 Tax=Midichloria mitochondrii (strain IricVA) TaxID=696127 RepID=F7XWD3_MIDMI|nr:VCBS repeat-containing protein [Candidatus Midichloria mitochondrii]AEI88982.1 hypothetical protein midi_00685 [Candidatus Midichloria mitochondrii IricVA]MDJ1255972.1 VCBS repeat-containing protein [Candidatus Midichloria mitochondrii]MDJ1287976.1 VCBS repeat-containing protein [Candidatus Midichloria mitochondrii]MDJ1298501.1 VCBS repeat-containing protein [Candidatus Midichloria mitochondrii]MDJ1312652.1 VCBS repeat-containing protein [Candidatus Midichloria mitochondrii]
MERLDIVNSNHGGNSVAVLLGKGDRTFQASTLHGIGGCSPWGVAVGDFIIEMENLI